MRRLPSFAAAHTCAHICTILPLALAQLPCLALLCCTAGEQWAAIADNYSLALDINGNLPPTVLDVLANDQGKGLKIVSYRRSSTEGYLVMDNNKFFYQLMQYR